jgi:hypothetical protein
MPTGLQHRICDGTDQVGRDVDAVGLVERRKPALVFGDQLRVEPGLVARYLQVTAGEHRDSGQSPYAVPC